MAKGLTADAIIREVNIAEDTLSISVSVLMDRYDYHVHSPKVTLVFVTEGDERRMPIPVKLYEAKKDGNGCEIFCNYRYFWSNIFWDICWKECKVYVDAEYGEERFIHVPLTVQGKLPVVNGVRIIPDVDCIHISMDQTIDSRCPSLPGITRNIVALFIHLVTIFIGIVLLPWFMVDSLGILILGTETKNRKITGSFGQQFILYVGWRFFGFCRNTRGLGGLKEAVLRTTYYFCNSFVRNKKKILFLSNRRNDLTGNFEYVYEKLKGRQDVLCNFWLENLEKINDVSLMKVIKLGKYLGESKVILIDDFTPLLNNLNIDSRSKIIQLWHACGAFKMFGFSRMGKLGGLPQASKAHRYYDYAVVSGSNIIPYYAEGFGIAPGKVLPLGMPRTDIFFDDGYKQETRKRLYSTYPGLKGKKIILFAPTFRGDGKMSAFYERARFDPNMLVGGLPEEYVLIIKHHPFVQMEYSIREGLENRIFDFSGESEINDLLLITDLLITDYSSVIFEAALMEIPMLFYAFDRKEYIATRDIYSEYGTYVPGKIVKTQKELLEAIRKKDYNTDKVGAFRDWNFDYQDGKASERVADLICRLAKG